MLCAPGPWRLLVSALALCLLPCPCRQLDWPRRANQNPRRLVAPRLGRLDSFRSRGLRCTRRVDGEAEGAEVCHFPSQEKRGGVMSVTPPPPSLSSNGSQPIVQGSSRSLLQGLCLEAVPTSTGSGFATRQRQANPGGLGVGLFSLPACGRSPAGTPTGRL